MKKHTIQSIGAAALAGLLFFGGCSDTLETDSPVQSSSSTGTVRVQIGDSDARTAIPTITLGTFDRIGLEFTNTNTWATPVTPTYSTAGEYSLEPGTWTLKVTGYKGTGANEKAVVSGTSNSFVVRQGETTDTVKILLDKAATDIAGTFTYNFTLPHLDEGYNNPTLTLTPVANTTNSGTVTINLTTPTQFNTVVKSTVPATLNQYTVDGRLSLPAGQYRMDLKLESNRSIATSQGTKYATVFRQEVVYIYPDTITNIPSDIKPADHQSYTWAESDFVEKLRLSGTVDLGSFYTPTRVELLDNTGNVLLPTTGGNNLTRVGTTTEYTWVFTDVSAKTIGQAVNLNTNQNFKVHYTYGNGRTGVYTKNVALPNFSGSNNLDLSQSRVVTGPTGLSGLRAQSTVSTPITIRWDPVENAVSYEVYDYDTNMFIGSTTNLTTPSYTISAGSLSVGTSYSYYVKAVGGHNSANSGRYVRISASYDWNTGNYSYTDSTPNNSNHP